MSVKTPTKKYKAKVPIPTNNREQLAQYPDFLAHLLYHRGVTDAETADRFINPDYDRDTHDSFLMLNMEHAVVRILQAIANEEKTIIYSDYDTDGIPAGVALHDFFKKVGFKDFTNYIPHRHDEGFGLNEDAIKQFAKDKVKLLITIDCGIADVEHVRLAQSKGIDVIVTDHHIPGAELPPAYAILNPKQTECAYPEKMLCGAGVIYKLIQALIIRGTTTSADGSVGIFEGKVKPGWEKWLLDMIGIATLSDMVPLRGENRAFAHYGLRVLRISPRLGLVKLLKKLGVQQKHLVEEDIGFTIGPRINAASRMGVPMDAFRLLATADETEADIAADHLNEINDERKLAVGVLVKEVKKVVRERYEGGAADAEGSAGGIDGVIFAGNPKWKPALLGLVANTCAQEYNRPVFLWGRDGDNAIKGSCRSDGVTNLVQLMQDCPDGTFIQFGGHSQSGGFAVSAGMIHKVEERLNEAFLKQKTVGEDRSAAGGDELFVDTELSLGDVNWDTYRKIEQLAPFGTGNPKPLFIFRNIRPVGVKKFGKEGGHLELDFGGVGGGNSGGIKAIGFFMTPESWAETLGRELRAGESLSLVATFEKSMFRGRTELRLRIVDIL